MTNILTGYRTYSAAIAVILTQLCGLIPGQPIPDDVINAVSILLSVAVVWFNKIGRDKIKKAVK